MGGVVLCSPITRVSSVPITDKRERAVPSQGFLLAPSSSHTHLLPKPCPQLPGVMVLCSEWHLYLPGSQAENQGIVLAALTYTPYPRVSNHLALGIHQILIISGTLPFAPSSHHCPGSSPHFTRALPLQAGPCQPAYCAITEAALATSLWLPQYWGIGCPKPPAAPLLE